MPTGPILHLSVPVSDLSVARRFYEGVLGCPAGRVCDDWMDVWFFGLQLTLQLRPDEVRAPEEQGVRHFGVVLEDRASLDDIVERVSSAGLDWLSPPIAHTDESLSGKVGGKLADPSGNVIEVKYYEDTAELFARHTD